MLSGRVVRGSGLILHGLGNLCGMYFGGCGRGPDLADADNAGKVEQVPRSGSPERAVRDGVWLFFENSTGCLISQCQVIYTPDWQAMVCGLLVWIPLATLLLSGQFFNKFLLESLILAQDERWRRA